MDEFQVLADIFLTRSVLHRIFDRMDALKELFAYFDNRITELPFLYPKKAFFQEFKESATDPYLQMLSPKWFTLRLQEYCEKHGYQLNPHGRIRKWDNTQQKDIDYLYISK